MKLTPPRVVTSTVLPSLDGRQVTIADGRIAWPSIVQYLITRDDGADYVADAPPTEKALREPSVPSPMPKQAQPRTERYSYLVYDQARYDVLCATGAIRDPWHTGAGSEIRE